MPSQRENNDKNDLSLEFRIKEIQEIDFKVISLKQDLHENFNNENLDFNFKFGLNENEETNEFGIFIEVSYLYGETEDSRHEYVNIKVEVRYEIRNIGQYMNQENEQIELPEDLLASLLGIAFSTVRGVVSTRTKGTYWQDFYLPIINPTKVIRNYKQQEKSKED